MLLRHPFNRILSAAVPVAIALGVASCGFQQPLLQQTAVTLGPALVAGDLAAVYEATFPVVNTTGRTVEVVEAVTSCGCLEADIDPGPLEPGASREVRVRYFPRPGQVSTDTLQVAVRCRNAPTIWAAVHVITFPRLEVTPRFVGFGELFLGQAATSTVRVRVRAKHGERKPLELAAVATRRGIVTIEDSGWTEDEEGTFRRWTRVFTLTLPPSSRLGAASDELLLTFDRPVVLSHHDQPARTISVPLHWNRLPLVSATPSTVFLPAGGRAVVRLRKHTATKIRVTGVTLDPKVDGLRVETPVQRELPFEVTVSWQPPKERQGHGAVVSLHVDTDSAAQPRVTVPISLSPVSPASRERVEPTPPPAEGEVNGTSPPRAERTR